MNRPSREAIDAYKEAVNSANASALRSLLEEHQGLKAVLDEQWFSFGATAMTLAAGRSDRTMIDVLLDAGADINRKSDWKPGPYAPIHSLTYGNGNLDARLANYLIERGAVVDIHAAAGLGRIDLLEQFVRAEPEMVHQRGPDGQMPLSMAGTPEAAAWLLEHGADINARCIDHGSTALQWSVTNRPEVARLLIERGAPVDVFVVTVLGDVDQLKALLDKDPKLLQIRCNADAFQHHGEAGNILHFTLGENATLLHIAATHNQPAVIDMLIERGLDSNVIGDYDDCAPLHKAAWHNHVDAARRLIAHGADMEKRSGKIHNNTPIGWAIVGGSKDFIGALLEAGAEVLEHYHKDAKAGEEGAFRAWNKATPEDYQVMQQLLMRK